MKNIIWTLLLFPALTLGDVQQSSFTVSVTVVANPTSGKALFETVCAHCHTFQDMQNVPEQTIRASLKKPDHLFNLSNKQIQDLVSYLQTYY